MENQTKEITYEKFEELEKKYYELHKNILLLNSKIEDTNVRINHLLKILRNNKTVEHYIRI